LIEILEDPDVLLQVIRTELVSSRKSSATPAAAKSSVNQEDLDILDLIAPEDVVVTLSHTGYAKRQPVSIYRAQRRGGKGAFGIGIEGRGFHRAPVDGQHARHLADLHQHRRVFWLRCTSCRMPAERTRSPIINWIAAGRGREGAGVLPVREYSEANRVLRHRATARSRRRRSPNTPISLARGKRAIGLDEDDALVDVQMTDGERDIMLFASNGKTVRFGESKVRPTGRTSTGVRGIRLGKGEEVVSLIVRNGDGDILTATERGYGKRTALDEYPRKGRGNQGVIGIQCSTRNGALVGAVQVSESHELMLISNQGTLVRTRVAEVAKVGRNTQGVTLIRLPDDEKLVGLVQLDAMETDGEDSDADASDATPPPADA
jgi:DNA gyrase subunit A